MNGVQKMIDDRLVELQVAQGEEIEHRRDEQQRRTAELQPRPPVRITCGFLTGLSRTIASAKAAM